MSLNTVSEQGILQMMSFIFFYDISLRIEDALCQDETLVGIHFDFNKSIRLATAQYPPPAPRPRQLLIAVGSAGP